MIGWKWVPVEPTRRMLAAGVSAEANAPTHVQERLTLYAYRAMLAAAPPPAADAANPWDALEAARDWIGHAPHGDNCYVSAHYPGDPGDRCNCGKDSIESYIDDVLAARGK